LKRIENAYQIFLDTEIIAPYLQVCGAKMAIYVLIYLWTEVLQTSGSCFKITFCFENNFSTHI